MFLDRDSHRRGGVSSRIGGGERKEKGQRKFFGNFRGKYRGQNGRRGRKRRGFGGGRERYQKHFMVSVRAAYVGSRWLVRALSGAMFVFQLLSAQRAARQV